MSKIVAAPMGIGQKRGDGNRPSEELPQELMREPTATNMFAFALAQSMLLTIKHADRVGKGTAYINVTRTTSEGNAHMEYRQVRL